MKLFKKSPNRIANAAGVDDFTALKTEEEYTAALALVETQMDAEAGSPEDEEQEPLFLERHEQEQFPIELPEPVRRKPTSAAAARELPTCFAEANQLMKAAPLGITARQHLDQGRSRLDYR